MSTYRDLARTRPHLRMLLEFLTCRVCAERYQDPSRKLCAYDFAADSWFCSEEHRAEHAGSAVLESARP